MARRFRFLGLGPEGALTIVLTLVVAVAAIGLREVPALEALEGRSLDVRFRIRGPLPPSTKVAIVALDDRTLDALGRWPVSRVWLARAVDAAAAAGAAVMAFDLLLAGAEGKPGADETLRRAIERFGKAVVPFAFTFTGSGDTPSGLPPVLDRAAYTVVHRPTALGAGPRLLPKGLRMPLPGLLQAGVPAHVTLVLDADGHLRRTLPVIGYGGAYFPSLSIVAARLFLGLTPSDVAVHIGDGLMLGDRRVPTGPDMRLPVNHLGPVGHVPTHSLIDLIEGRLPPEALRGRVVLIGATAQGVGDRFATPFGQNVPGVEVFAAALDNILEKRSLERSVRSEGWDLLAVLACGLLVAALAWQSAPLVTLAAGAGIIALWGVICTGAFISANLWLSFVFPAAAAGIGAAVVAAAQSLRERGRRRQAEQARASLARYVSPLAGTEARPPSEGVRHAAVMFADLRSFTAASEALSAEQTMDLLRGFHRRVERVVTQSQGEIDKFIGDGVLAVFGAQGSDPDAARKAVACVRALADEIAAWTRARAAHGAPPVHVSIGAHLGPVMLGEVGGEAYAQMTVTGDTVNVASRLEALTRTHGVTILASDALIEAARAAGASLEGFVELPMQEIRGRRRPLGVWAWPAPSEREKN